MDKIFISCYNTFYSKSNPSVLPCFYEIFLEALKKAGNKLLIFRHREFALEA